MNSVTCFTKSIDSTRAAAAFADLSPDLHHCLHVRPSRYQHLVSTDPFQAGVELHELLPCLGTHQAFSPKDKGYFPYLAALRGYLHRLGVNSLVPEQRLASVAPVGHGRCDLLVHGGFASKGVVEIKVVHDLPARPDGLNLTQTGLYARLVAGWGDYDRVWAAVAYVDLRRHVIKVMSSRNASRLIFRAMDLWQEAA
jgi:hypothetical protein